MTEDKMVGWHYQLNRHEFEQVLGVGDGQESLVCYSPWGCRVRHGWLNWTEPTELNCHPLLLLPLTFLSIRVFPIESVLHIRWPKYWSLTFSISPSGEYSGLSSFRIDWFDLAVEGTLKSLLQHHHWKASILWHSAFFIVQLSHPYMTTGKTIALTRWTFVSKVMSLPCICYLGWSFSFLPRSKRLLISWLQSPSAVILEPKKIKFVTVSIVFPSICHEVMGPDARIFIFWMFSFKLAFHFPLSPSSRGSLISFCFLP